MFNKIIMDDVKCGYIYEVLDWGISLGITLFVLIYKNVYFLIAPIIFEGRGGGGNLDLV